ADIGNTNYGQYRLHVNDLYATSAIWNTTSGARIGVTNHAAPSGGYQGRVEVYDRGVWNIASRGANAAGLIVGQDGSAFLDICRDLDNIVGQNGGQVNVNDGVIIGQNATSRNNRVDVHDTGAQLNVRTGDLIVSQLGASTMNVYNNGRATVLAGNAYVAQQAGSAGTVNVYSGGGKTVNGNMFVAEERNTTGTVNVYGAGSFLTVTGDLITGRDTGTPGAGFSQGNLYAWGGSTITVNGNHTIADGVNALGRDYIDGAGTTMRVVGTLTVGNNGQAGGTYTENRYDPRYQNDPATGDWLNGWWDGANFIHHSRTPLNNIATAKTSSWTGNDPGLAITRGAAVASRRGVMGVGNNGDPGDPNVNGKPLNDVWANGYGVIDNAGNTGYAANAWGYNPVAPIYDPYAVSAYEQPQPFNNAPTNIVNPTASRWDVQEDLVIAENGNAFLRVLNGGLLRTGLTGNNATGESTVIGSGIGNGTLHVYGSDTAWGRSMWLSRGATIVGDANHSRGTIRINDGALGETAGLYIGTATGAQGEVSVMGSGSTLHITANDPGYRHVYDVLNPPTALAGTGLFSASDHALVWMDQESEIRLNGIAQISTGSILHLHGVKDNPLPVGTPYTRGPNGAFDPVFDAGTRRVNFTNARLEGIGTVTGADGVHFLQDDTWTPMGGPFSQASIDPGVIYGWETKCEKDYYGTLTFGHTLNLSGNVITYFDVNAGYDPGVAPAPWTGGSHAPEQDHIIVQGDPNNTTDQVVATLGGTLLLHARLTNYFDNDLEYDIVTTIGANGTKGLIDKEFDTLQIKPWRFFTGAEQWIDENALGNDVLYVRMALNESPFESSAQTYNERSVGRVLDQIYSYRNQEWLPFLRQFWYIDDDDEFRQALRLYSGEVRAHSMLMPIQNPWTYAFERNGFSRCTGHAFFGPQNRSCNITSGRNLWGTYIHTNNATGSDGNAGDYDLRRNGFAVGYERASKGGNSYLGAMFAFNQGKLNAWRSDAKSDDFQFGLYHGKSAWDKWEWKNYFGMGIQNYKMSRNLDMALTTATLNSGMGAFVCDDHYASGNMLSNFAGLTLAGSTELARPFYFGKCSQWTLRPYMGLDLMAVWQNRASEDGLLVNTATGEEAYYTVNGVDYRFADLVALDYYSSTNVRLYGRPGIMLERGGSNGHLRMGVSYSYLMGGHRYTNVNNQFQYAGDKFNIRGVDDGSGFVTANVGAAAYVGKRKLSMVYIDYAVLAGSHSTTQAVQLGFQRNF
ncbi:MAG: autotransporter domain-containing protein, partial [Planctomycetaceae bacterium]|nr:autotransporter domain-containing protein [Planctomycetaceae bacterium]